MSSPAPKSPDISEKSKKYDRQIRLWGEHGQTLLENARIALVNATAVGCEVLKALVLPGVGSFTIIDSTTVTEDDLGFNFFLDVTHIGKSKALAAMNLMQELNPDVNGDYVDESVNYILNTRLGFFESFDVVVASNLSEDVILSLAHCLWEANIPLIYCRSLGLFGSVRLQIAEHCIVEAHPDNQRFDLRLERPFEALKKHFDGTAVTNKVPWLLVLNKYLELWRAQHNGQVPSNYKEKSQFRDLIRDGISNDEENHEEAIKAVNTAFGGAEVPSNLKTIFDDDACRNLSKKSKPFWIMAKALKDFIEQDNNGLLPLPGTLPDMTANTENYIALQNIYRQQALHDADSVYRKCQNYLRELELSSDIITERQVRLLCREARGIEVIRGSCIVDEYKKDSRLSSLVEEWELNGTLTENYMGFRAYERFLTECGNIPGESFVENDVARIKQIANKMLADLGMHVTISDDMLHEITHYGGSELHAVSAFVGGCAAQEAIKVITKQYKPIDNTFLYNAITTASSTLKL